MKYRKKKNPVLPGGRQPGGKRGMTAGRRKGSVQEKRGKDEKGMKRNWELKNMCHGQKRK